MAPLGSRLASLWRPHPSLRGGAARRRARLAAGILLVLMPILLLAFLFPDDEGAFLSGRRLTAIAVVGLGASYAVVRLGHVSAGVLLAVATIELALGLSVGNADTHDTGLQVLAFFVVPIAMAGILLPMRWAAVVGATTIAVALGLESTLEGQGVAAGPDQHALTLALQLLAVYALAVVAAAMVERQARLLEESRELLRTVTDNIPEVFFLVSGDGRRTLYTSPAYESVVGRRVAQSMADARDWLKAVHPEDLPRVASELEAGRREIQYRIVHPANGVRHMRVRTFPVRSPDGGVETLVGIAEDVTVAVRAQEQVREAQAQRIQLLQQLAHDLAAPMSPLRIQLRLLRDRIPPEGAKAFGIVHRNVEHLQRLVEDVKDVARLEGGALRLDLADVDIAVLARQAAESLAPGAAERQVQVAVHAPAPVRVAADPGRITQVLYNLVGNALKFTPPGGTITVSVRADADTVDVQVRDDGSGMRPDQVARLFQPFVQVHDAGTALRAEDKGSGLGLYISKGIVEAHGGTIGAASAGPGQGSTFTFRLPLAGPSNGPR